MSRFWELLIVAFRPRFHGKEETMPFDLDFIIDALDNFSTFAENLAELFQNLPTGIGKFVAAIEASK